MPAIVVAAAGRDEAHGEGLSSRNGDTHGLDLSMPPEHDKKSKLSLGTSPMTLSVWGGK